MARDFEVDPIDLMAVFILRRTYEEFDKLASRKRTTVAAVLAEALAEYLKKENENGTRSI